MASTEASDAEKALNSESDATQGPPATEAHPQRTIRGFRWFLVCVGVFSANLLYGLDTTISADIQASVSTAFANVTQLGWLGFGFGLGATVSVLPLGQGYGLFDVKPLYIGCLVMFAAGSALCGAAPSMAALIVGRVWAGVGGAGMYLGTLNIITSLTSPREQAFYVGFEGLVYGVGCILGPIVGGLLADSAATWRWAFYLNLVIFAVTAPIYLFVLPSIPRRVDVPFRHKLANLDWLGIVLNTALYVSFTLAFGLGGAVWPWHDGRFVACVVVFGVLVIAFCATQALCVLTTPEHRLFPCDFLRDPQLVLLFLAVACGGAGLFVSVYYIPLYFLFVHGDSGTRAAVRLLPFVAFYVVSITACGYALPRFAARRHWLWFLGSGLLLTAGGAAMHSIGTDTAASHTYGFSLLLGFGLACSMASYYVAGLCVPPSRAPALVQFINLGQCSSQMLALVIASAIFQSEAQAGLQTALAGHGFSKTQIQGALAGAHSAIFDQMTPDLRRRCLDVIVATIQKEWVLVVAAGALLVVCSCFLDKSRA